MIERLVMSLRALGGSADEQLARLPDFADFDDAYLLLRQCQQLELSSAQRDAVAAVDRLLGEVIGLRTEAALRRAPEWERVREAARAALRELDYDEEPTEHDR